MQIFAKTKPRNKKRNKIPKQIKHCNELKKPRDQQVAGLFFIEILHYFPVSVAGRQECGD